MAFPGPCMVKTIQQITVNGNALVCVNLANVLNNNFVNVVPSSSDPSNNNLNIENVNITIFIFVFCTSDEEVIRSLINLKIGQYKNMDDFQVKSIKQQTTQFTKLLLQ